jgi:hypothetical protein
MDDLRAQVEPLSRSLVVDGPPFVAVALVFVLLVALWWGAGRPVAGLAALAVGLVATVALDFREWLGLTRDDRRAADATAASLPARLEEARASQVERDRWR